jgi:hypothetical protein
MSTSFSGQGPAVIPRSHYVHVRGFLVATIVALTAALGVSVATDSGTTHVTRSAQSVPFVSPAHDSHEITPCGVRYVGDTLVGKSCATTAERPN